MAEQYTVRVTHRGQVALPARVRQVLGLSPGDRVIFQVEGQEVRLASARFSLETAFASVPPLQTPASLEDVLAVARDEHAQHVLAESEGE